MKKEKAMELNAKAFAFAGAVLGLLLMWIMPNMMGYGSGMMGFNGSGYNWMMGGGFGLNIWMAIVMGVVAGLFAWIYNVLLEKMN